MYVNPGKELRRWDRYPAFANTAEVVAFHDVDRRRRARRGGAQQRHGVGRDGEPGPRRRRRGRFIPSRAPATQSRPSTASAPVTSTATGAIDVVTPYGWWEHPANWIRRARGHIIPSRSAAGRARVRARAAASCASADFNGDGLNDVVASLEAHGWGLAWFEQKRSPAGEISWVQHMIIDDLASKNPGGVAISEIHAITTADVDGDGITDVIAGKRLFSHLDTLHRSRSARRCGALRVPHRARQPRAGRSDVRPAARPQSVRRRFDGADGRLEQGRRRRYPHGHKPRHVYFLGHREKRCEEVGTCRKPKSIVVGSHR